VSEFDDKMPLRPPGSEPADVQTGPFGVEATQADTVLAGGIYPPPGGSGPGYTVPVPPGYTAPMSGTFGAAPVHGAPAGLSAPGGYGRAMPSPPPPYGYGAGYSYGGFGTGYGYAPQAYAYPGVPRGPRTETMAVLSLIFSSAAWLLCLMYGIGIIGSIAGVVVGFFARRKIRESGGLLSGDGLALAGILIGLVNIGFFLGGIVLVIVMVASSG